MKKESFFFLIWAKGNLIFVYGTIEDTGSISQQKLNFEKKDYLMMLKPGNWLGILNLSIC